MRHLTTMAALLLVAACGGEEVPEQPADVAEPADSTVLDPLTGTLDRARGVEDTLRDAAAERRRQLEEQEQ